MQGCAVMMVVLPNETNTSDQVNIADECSSPVHQGLVHSELHRSLVAAPASVFCMAACTGIRAVEQAQDPDGVQQVHVAP